MIEVLPALAPADLGEFFAALWGGASGQQPFEWQTELVEQLHSTRRWPGLIDLPTGCGKTSLLDIAIFLLALDAANDPPERWMPRRLVLVVDRRVIVDQADDRAKHLIAALHGADAGVLAVVRERLAYLSGGGSPLRRSVLRGGITTDEVWARRPDVPVIISSTVDQVGSRLLFRGYGVSKGMRPIHAGLLGNDTLLLLDEVHLARPFAETLAAIASYRTQCLSADALPQRWHVVEMSATPRSEGEPQRFPKVPIVTSSHPVLARRLAARKPVALVPPVVVKGDAQRANAKFAKACADEARSLLEGSARTIGVIVNRVDTARRVARELEEDNGPAVVLLTGRMRPFDRDRCWSDWRERLMIGRERTPDAPPVVVVATQSVEAGADIDLDAMVTECASLDALRQRFGRVDRDGQLTDAGREIESKILIRSSDVEPIESDPVYGMALSRTWRWLQGQARVDFGITRMVAPEGTFPAELMAEASRAPRLLPSELDRWAQTSHRPPAADPDVGRWLHGLSADADVAEIGIVWRADLDESLLDPKNLADHPEIEQEILDRVTMCPPTSSETLAVPLRVARSWAKGDLDGLDTSDMVGAKTDATSENREGGDRRRLLRWRGESSAVIEARGLRPGDVVIVPASRGGLTKDNWDPAGSSPVRDVATPSIVRRRGQAVVRLAPGLFAPAPPDEDQNPASYSFEDPETMQLAPDTERREILARELAMLADQEDDPVTAAVLRHLAGEGHRLRFRALADAVIDGRIRRSYVVTTKDRLASSFPLPWDGDDEATDVAVDVDDDDPDVSSFTGTGHAKLGDHLLGVGDWARKLSSNLGLPEHVAADLELAGRLHDAGKVDPRFQLYLHGGDEMSRARAGGPVAKSATESTDRQARRKARELSGYPAGARHELLSLAMIAGSPSPADLGQDPELVRHLVVSHHGFGRYRFEPVEDGSPLDVSYELDGFSLEASTGHTHDRLDFGAAATFWRLTRRYGWYQLAWLETILRLADHERSRAEGRPALSLGAGGAS